MWLPLSCARPGTGRHLIAAAAEEDGGHRAHQSRPHDNHRLLRWLLRHLCALLLASCSWEFAFSLHHEKNFFSNFLVFATAAAAHRSGRRGNGRGGWRRTLI